jgi:hypothetical protein
MTYHLPEQRPRRAARLWLAAIVVLLAIRLPSLVQPAGGDQSLYAYAAQRILAGDVLYRDMWDQKPPGIAFVYAMLLRVWPGEAVVPGADLAAAAGVAWLLVVLGRRRFSANVGYGAAVMFLLCGDPYLQRLGGIYVRGQCEPFIALAVTISLVLLAHRARRRPHLVAAGIALAGAFWLKYGGAYALPVAAAVWAWGRATDEDGRRTVADLAWVGLGFGIVAIGVLAYFAAHGALTDLRLATLDYNLRYSTETYDQPVSVPLYLLTFPVQRAMVDMLWFLGGLGVLLIARRVRRDGSVLVALAWMAAAVISIAVNGSRGLPNYFMQAAPAMALCGSAGLASLRTYAGWVRWAVAGLLLVAIARVGSDTPVWGLRLASLPGVIENVRYDLSYVRGRVDRDTYLRRFKGQKHDALEIDRLARYVRETTARGDRIFVFGFSGGSVCWKSERASASRFFWSMPVIREFAADRPGYGSAGLLEDLQDSRPVLVALQKEEWRSYDFFMNNERLRRWLDAGYLADRETPMFSVWRRKP